MPGPADPLDSRGDGRGRFDLNHQIDRPHVDPQFQRRGGDNGRQLTAFEPILDLQPLVLGDRAVVGQRQLLRRPVR